MNIPQNKMRTIVHLLLLIATAAGASIAIAFGLEYQRLAHLQLDLSGIAPQITAQYEAANTQTKGAPGKIAIANKTAKFVQSGQSGQSGHPLFAFLDQVLQKLPPGTQLDASQFDRVLGVDAGNYLRTAQIARIAVKADLFTVTLLQPRQVDLNGQADLRVAQKITFHFQKDQKDKSGGAIHLSQITGVEVRVSWLLGFMDVSRIDITGGANGDTSLVVTVDTLFGKKSRSFTVGADGKPKATSP